MIRTIILPPDFLYCITPLLTPVFAQNIWKTVERPCRSLYQTTSNLMEMYGVYSNFSDIVSTLQNKVIAAFPEINGTSECTAVELSQRSIESTVDSCTNTSSILTSFIKALGEFTVCFISIFTRYIGMTASCRVPGMFDHRGREMQTCQNWIRLWFYH